MHLVAQKLLCRLHAAVQILGLHRSQVKEHHDQAVVAQILGTNRDSCLALAGPRGQSADGGFAERRGHLHALEVEGRNLLLLAVFVDAEVALLESAHHFARLGIARHNVGQHQLAVQLEHEAALRLIGDLRHDWLCAREDQHQRRESRLDLLSPTLHELPSIANLLTH